MTDPVFDARAFRNALGRFPTGITVITTLGPNDKPEGLTANSFGAVSLEPALVQWCLGKNAPSLPVFKDCTHFAINVLKEDQRDISNRFATPAEDKFAGVEWRRGLAGHRLLPNRCVCSSAATTSSTRAVTISFSLALSKITPMWTGRRCCSTRVIMALPARTPMIITRIRMPSAFMI